MEQLQEIQDKLELVLSNINRVVIGKREVVTLSLVALLAEGHVLLEDVPGVGKTMMVKALAKSINTDFKRIQFTPDLLPSDVTGVSVYNPKDLEFHYRPGPVMSHFVLADEINRTSPKTQSALLEAMEESSVTTDGITRALPKPFFVMATQNPIEFDGTYQLPEAQLDRFLFRLKMGYPTIGEEVDILNRLANGSPIDELKPVIQIQDVQTIQAKVRNVYVDDTVKRYIVEIVDRTRNHPDIDLGVSPRGSVALMKATQAYSLLQGRDYCIPDDVQYLAPYVLSHRMTLRPEAKYERKQTDEIVKQILAKVYVPIKR
ncbi:MoxR family ATPase [Bacillus sp. CGMCC 1.16541]|uniref:AAA family ATPase n=1 Tax=Bacillus sp. CGMCC 1.16541 TaxID=2185143 RepID=UPI001EF672B6|nr:MoxR family ATPase [Bacillus sp. CGMCC 1.16541]